MVAFHQQSSLEDLSTLTMKQPLKPTTLYEFWNDDNDTSVVMICCQLFDKVDYRGHDQAIGRP